MFNKKDKKNKDKNEEEIPVEEQLDFGFDGAEDDFDDFDAFDDFEEDDENIDEEEVENNTEEVEEDVAEEPLDEDSEEDIEFTEDYEEPEEPEEDSEADYEDDYEEDYEEEAPGADEEYEDDYEEIETDDLEELPEEYDDEEYEEVEDAEEVPEVDEYEEEAYDDEEYEEVEDAEEVPEEVPEEDEYEEEVYDDEEYEEVEDAEEVPEEVPEEDEYEEEAYDDEEYEEVEDAEKVPEEDEYEEEAYDDEEYDEVEDAEEVPEEDEYEEEAYDDEEYEEVEDAEEVPEENEYEEEAYDDEEYDEVEDEEEIPEEDEEVEEIEEITEDENEQISIEDDIAETEDSQDTEIKDESEETENETAIEEENSEEIENEDTVEEEIEENEAVESDLSEDTEEGTIENIEAVLNEDEEDEEEADDTADLYPEELIDMELECIYIGLLFNNPKAISRYYLLYEDCRFSNKELGNLYRIIIFRDGEQYAPAQAKDKYQLPRENPKTYDLRWKVRKLAAAKNYNLENVYIELKKLFILKKNYVSAPTAAIRQKILEIQDYELYADMSVEEVESALEQITVTTGLSQAVLNKGATEFLLRGDTELSTGISLPFKIISTVFKGLRKGETMCYAMPSNSGKSRFAINMACYIAFIHKQKVLIISNEMSQEKMRLCMITTILNNPEIQKLHGQKVSKTEGELLELKFKADNPKRIKCDENGFILRKEGETQEEFIEKLNKYSKEFRAVTAATEWLDTQLNNSIYFIHITEHSNDDLRKIILNYYYKEGIEYMFYDTLKADTDHIGNGDEIKKTATILSNIAQKFKVFICSSMQLLESNTLPVNLNINDMSASKTVKEVLDTLCLMKQISRQTLKKYEYSDSELFEKTHKIKVPKDPDIRHYACVVDKNRAGAKPTVLFELNLAYNSWEELGHLRLIQTEMDEE